MTPHIGPMQSGSINCTPGQASLLTRLIAYGGDGREAYVTYFPLQALGYENGAMCPSGWAEWSQFPALPRESGE